MESRHRWPHRPDTPPGPGRRDAGRPPLPNATCGVPAAIIGTNQRPGMHVSLRHHTVERAVTRRYSSMRVIELTACRAASTFSFRRRDLAPEQPQGLLRDHDVVASDDTGVADAALSLSNVLASASDLDCAVRVAPPPTGASIWPRRAAPAIPALPMREEVASAHARAAIHANAPHVACDPRIDRHLFVRLEIPGHLQHHVKRTLDDAPRCDRADQPRDADAGRSSPVAGYRQPTRLLRPRPTSGSATRSRVTETTGS